MSRRVIWVIEAEAERIRLSYRRKLVCFESEGYVEAPQRELVVPEGDLAVPESDPAAPEGNPAAPERDPAVPEGDLAVPEGDPAVPEGDPAVPERDLAAPEGDLVAPERDLAVPEDDPAVPEGDLAALEGDPIVQLVAFFIAVRSACILLGPVHPLTSLPTYQAEYPPGREPLFPKQSGRGAANQYSA
jgi:hypothetical protein